MRPLKQAIYSSRTADKFVVRLPDGMRERIAEVARNHHRSMNSEIIARLEQSRGRYAEAQRAVMRALSVAPDNEDAKALRRQLGEAAANR